MQAFRKFFLNVGVTIAAENLGKGPRMGSLPGGIMAAEACQVRVDAVLKAGGFRVAIQAELVLSRDW